MVLWESVFDTIILEHYPIITMGRVLPLFLPQGFVPVVSFLKISIVDILVPLFRSPVCPQEKEPPNGCL
jgi:hypothetical protein